MAEKIRISKSEVIQIVKEEYAKKLKGNKLKKRLQEVSSEINTLIEGFGAEEETIEEVEANGTRRIPGGSADGLSNGDGFGKKHQIKGTHNLEEEEEIDIPGEEIGAEGDVEEIEIDIPGEEGGEIGFEDEVGEVEDIESLLAKLADAIETKVEDVVDAKVGGEEIGDAEGIEGAEEIEMGSEEEISPEGDVELQENAEEPQDGHSPATDQSTDAPGEKTPYTEKQTTINENQLISEAAKVRGQVLAGIVKGDLY